LQQKGTGLSSVCAGARFSQLLAYIASGTAHGEAPGATRIVRSCAPHRKSASKRLRPSSWRTRAARPSASERQKARERW